MDKTELRGLESRQGTPVHTFSKGAFTMRHYLNRALAFAIISLMTAAWLFGAGVSACAQTQASVTLSAGVVTINTIGLTTAAGNPLVLSQPNLTTNLLTLSSDAVTFLHTAAVPPSTYAELDV